MPAEEERRVGVGQAFHVRLEGTPTAGYTWNAEPPSSDAVEFLKRDFVPPGSGTVGGAAANVFLYAARHAGTAELHFVYRRPWESDRPPQREHHVLVHVE